MPILFSCIKGPLGIDFKQGKVIKYTISSDAKSMKGTLDEQIKVADMRPYNAKEGGRNQLVSA